MDELRFVSFSSGSCGNCYLLKSKEDGVLIDAGVSLRRLKQYLGALGLGFDSFSSILITHDHMDHVRNLGSYCKRLSKPVYATPVLHNALGGHAFDAPFLASCRRNLEEGVWNKVGAFMVRCFEVPHDATQTVGFAIVCGDRRFLIMTDMGRITDEALDLASKADTVVIESNYDRDMLMSGPYTHELKMRICQGSGHLANDECASAIRKFYHPGLRNLFLCHLSENNNTPGLAYESASAALESIGVKPGMVNLRALPRKEPSPFFLL